MNYSDVPKGMKYLVLENTRGTYRYISSNNGTYDPTRAPNGLQICNILKGCETVTEGQLFLAARKRAKELLARLGR